MSLKFVLISVVAVLIFIFLLNLNHLQATQFTSYQNEKMGIKFDYPDYWNLGFSSFFFPTNCQVKNCYQEIDFINDSIGFTVNMETIEYAECKCSSLLDYVKWYYN